uniref:Uncharacterized protein n=1 Tax=Timema monikensis TaxID=170555 RepID=A0A7R9EGR6_9NEOP|nr:unnamed protein product [Timema monikensis]
MGYLICLVIVLTVGANLATAQYSFNQGCPINCAAVFCAAIDPNVCFESVVQSVDSFGRRVSVCRSCVVTPAVDGVGTIG